MSPAATQSPADAQRAILDAADGLFYRRGIGGVAMSDVRDRSATSMRRLYTLYPSKHDLVTGWLQDRHDRWMRWFTGAVDRHVAAGSDGLMATLDALEEWVTGPDYRGCAFINSIAEAAEITDGHRAVIAAHKRDLIEHLTTLALRDRPNAPVWLAPSVGVVLDGTIVQCAIFESTAPLAAAREALQHLLDSLPS